MTIANRRDAVPQHELALVDEVERAFWPWVTWREVHARWASPDRSTEKHIMGYIDLVVEPPPGWPLRRALHTIAVEAKDDPDTGALLVGKRQTLSTMTAIELWVGGHTRVHGRELPEKGYRLLRPSIGLLVTRESWAPCAVDAESRDRYWLMERDLWHHGCSVLRQLPSGTPWFRRHHHGAWESAVICGESR